MRPEFDPADIANANESARLACFHDNVAEGFGLLKSPLGDQRVLNLRIVLRRWTADLTDRRLNILGLNCRCDIIRCYLERCHAHGIHPDAHAILGRPHDRRFANTSHARQGICHIHGKVVGYVEFTECLIRGIEPESHQEIRRACPHGDPLLGDRGR
ncbi:hypothetical protein GGD56_006324 [Rhizobium mongolense]|uniref:Uncharacterized protein n=1 Tax=Rhizobium mongolense TaxID=57676 RepID=A0ABR6IY20_9HYPH|nr:hypothetical protein [Rhizobium mongolense]